MGLEIQKEEAQLERLEFRIDLHGSKLPLYYPMGIVRFIPWGGEEGVSA